jgi:flagellar hook-basal body complex protein FliE
MDVSSVSSLSTILKVASMVFPQLAMLSSLTNLLTKAFGEGIKGAVDQLVKENGMPKFIGDLVKKAVDEGVSGAQKESSPESDAAAQAQGGDAAKTTQQQVNESILNDTVNNMKGKGKGKGSWLEALAAALGEAANKQAEHVEELAGKITGDGMDKPKAMSDLQAASQRLSFMMNAIDQVIKTIGEALATAARKQ